MSHIYLALCAVHLVAVASPGPGFFVEVRNTLSGGFKVGIATAFGIASGDFVLLMISILGASAVIASHPQGMHWIQVFGAIYITYLGLQALRSFARGFKGGNIQDSVAVVPHITIFEGFRSGFLTTILNPKAIVYFLSLSSQFIKPTQSLAVNVSLGALMILITLYWFTKVSFFVGNPFIRKKMLSHQYKLDGLMGVILVAFGVYALLFLV